MDPGEISWAGARVSNHALHLRFVKMLTHPCAFRVTDKNAIKSRPPTLCRLRPIVRWDEMYQKSAMTCLALYELAVKSRAMNIYVTLMKRIICFCEMIRAR